MMHLVFSFCSKFTGFILTPPPTTMSKNINPKDNIPKTEEVAHSEQKKQDVKLEDLLQEIFVAICDTGVEAIHKYFHRDYIHRVNGTEIDYETYEKHFAERQKFLASASFEIEQIIAAGDQVGTVHKFHLEKTDGTKTSLQLIAIWQFRDQKLIRGDEVAKLIEGDLASVVLQRES